MVSSSSASKILPDAVVASRDRRPGVQPASRAFAGRKEQLEGRAAARFAVDLDGAMVPAHDAKHGGQAQAAPGEFGGEERVEDPIQGGLVHAMAGVRDFHVDKVPWHHPIGAKAAFEVVGLAVGQTHRDRDDPAALADGLGRVDNQVHNNLPQLRRIGIDRRDPVREVVLEHHLLADAHQEQVPHFLDQLAQVQGLDDEAAAAAVGQKLAA
jgi:hypothetical protein